MRLAKALIRLRVCAGWSEPLLVAHTTLLEISCRGSIIDYSLNLKKICFASFIYGFNASVKNSVDLDQLASSEKPVFGGLLITQAQTSLRIRAV